MNIIKLIVGLANPGLRYKKTRHNIGSWYVNLLAKRYCKKLKKEKKFFGYTSKLNLINSTIHLLIPNTFMNLSGTAVLSIANFYNIKINEILIAHDEMDLSPGIIKTKIGGNNSGHNGLKDIQNKFNNPNFYRLRIGINHPNDKNKTINFLLNEPLHYEKKIINKVINILLDYQEIIMQTGNLKANFFHLNNIKTIKYNQKDFYNAFLKNNNIILNNYINN
ncbi:Peptidyl-tRNA hydrolase [Serratia symbiotica]|nr:Peptidyl-tRNA hydrolase [Serratia symbiotica]